MANKAIVAKADVAIKPDKPYEPNETEANEANKAIMANKAARQLWLINPLVHC